MKGIKSKYNTSQNIVRWIARGISSLAIAFFIFMIIGDLTFISEPWTLEGGLEYIWSIILCN